MSRDAPIKAEKDYTELLDEQFPQVDLLGKVSVLKNEMVAISHCTTDTLTTYI